MNISESTRPRQGRDFIGFDRYHKELKNWVQHRKGFLLILGSSGNGKTSLAEIVMKMCKYDAVFMEDVGSMKELSAAMTEYDKQCPLVGLPQGVILDDIEKYRIKLSDIAKGVTKWKTPLVITATALPKDVYPSTLKHQTVVTIEPPSKKDTQEMIKRVCQVMKGDLTHAQVVTIHEKCGGDLRQAANITDFEIRCTGDTMSTSQKEVSSSSLEGEHIAIRKMLGIPLPSLRNSLGKHPLIDAESLVKQDGKYSCIVHEQGILPFTGSGDDDLEEWGKCMDHLCVADMTERVNSDVYSTLVANTVPSSLASLGKKNESAGPSSLVPTHFKVLAKKKSIQAENSVFLKFGTEWTNSKDFLTQILSSSRVEELIVSYKLTCNEYLSLADILKHSVSDKKRYSKLCIQDIPRKKSKK